jgi:queuine tRNA-ribosyltransferase
MEIQEGFGVDIAMAFDVCPAGDAPRNEVESAVELTTRWAKQCLLARQDPEATALFGIVQGGTHRDLRQQHAAALTALPFDGFAIGGVSVGEQPQHIRTTVDYIAPLLPSDRPRYLMGVGTPEDIHRAVAAGVDMFDCVLPTRNARNGMLFTSTGPVSIKRAEYAEDLRPIDESCTCSTCQRYSRAFLRHLFVCRELSYHQLATIHNLAFYEQHLRQLRKKIAAGRFSID